MKKLIVNSAVALFFLYVIGLSEKERIYYKKKYEEYYEKYKSANESSWKTGYDAGWDTAIEYARNELDSMKFVKKPENEVNPDDPTRYS